MGKIFLLPGWATDSKIFKYSDLPDFIEPIDYSIKNYEEILLKKLEKKKLFIIAGWSMGAFISVDFCNKYPSIFEKIILISCRKKYNPTEIKKIKEYILKNKNAFLYKFYNSFFTKEEKEFLNILKKELFPLYLETFDQNYLIESLSYLEDAFITVEKLKKMKKILFIHGDSDNIAPVEEVLSLNKELPNSKLITIPNGGHAVFLNKCFKWDLLYE